MIKIRPILFVIFYFAIALLLSGCKFALLAPKGLIAADEKNILSISTFLMLIVVVPVVILTFLFAWRYREGNTRAKYTPEWSHSLLLEIIWWSIPCFIVVALGVITWNSTHRLDPYKPLVVKGTKSITIQAIALRWKWLFIYPEQNIATINFLQFPLDVPINFVISAEGPMNSLQIPQLAGQIYAMAGMQTKLHLIANEIGDYQGISANFSGDGFSDMKFTVRVSSVAQFTDWLKTVKQSPAKLTMIAYNDLVAPSEKLPVQYFSSANKNIFETVIMKAMMPMPMHETAIANNTTSLVVAKKGNI